MRNLQINWPSTCFPFNLYNIHKTIKSPCVIYKNFCAFTPDWLTYAKAGHWLIDVINNLVLLTSLKSSAYWRLECQSFFICKSLPFSLRGAILCFLSYNYYVAGSTTIVLNTSKYYLISVNTLKVLFYDKRFLFLICGILKKKTETIKHRVVCFCHLIFHVLEFVH